MATATVVPEQEQQVKTEALTVVDKSKSITISDQQSYDAAAELLTMVIKPAQKKIAEFFDPMQKAAHAAWQAILTRRKEVDVPLAEAEKDIKLKLAAWDDQQERLRREEEDRLKKEAEERDRKQKEQTALEAIEQCGSNEEAEQVVAEIMSMPSAVAAPVAAPTYQRNSAVSVRKAWEAELVSLQELCKAIGSGRADLVYLVTLNQTAANQIAKAQRSAMNIPGLKAVEKSIVAGRSK